MLPSRLLCPAIAKGTWVEVEVGGWRVGNVQEQQNNTNNKNKKGCTTHVRKGMEMQQQLIAGMLKD